MLVQIIILNHLSEEYNMLYIKSTSLQVNQNTYLPEMEITVRIPMELASGITITTEEADMVIGKEFTIALKGAIQTLRDAQKI